MANNNTGLFIVAGLGLLWFVGRGRAAPVPGGGPVTVRGSLGGVTVSQASMGQTSKRQGEQAIVVATYSVQANKGDGTPIAWPYKLLMVVIAKGQTVYSSVTAPFTVPPMQNQKWSWGFPTPGAVGDLLSVTVQLLGAVQDQNGSPTNVFGLLDAKVSLDAIKVVSNLVGVAGSVSAISVSQGGIRFGQGPSRYNHPQAELFQVGKPRPWINDKRAPI